jgi:hypothetical protein
MIHFQHYEPGACLRASEVKPKLDRFLAEQLKGALLDGWLIDKPNGHRALDYKMRFVAVGEKQVAEPHKLYFGNMGAADAEKRQTVFYPDGVDMTIICFRKELSEKIDDLLPCFFALHAFGTRSGKGFGCFCLAERQLQPEQLLACCPQKVYYQISYPRAPGAAVFNDIWVLSGMMKGGFNFTFRNAGDYYKGRIFRYFSNKGVGGDKAFIKQKVLRGQDQNAGSEERVPYKEYRFVRAMLGLPGGFEFRRGPKTTRSGKVEVQSNAVDRFQSPVHFRLQGSQLLIFPQKIPEGMLNAAFTLNKQPIKTPETFDLIDFLDQFSAEFNARIDIASFRSPDIRNTLVSDRRLTIQKKIGGAV